jgi:hypothetical protein
MLTARRRRRRRRLPTRLSTVTGRSRTSGCRRQLRGGQDRSYQYTFFVRQHGCCTLTPACMGGFAPE